MIFIDLETTGLLVPEGDVSKQPKIIEICLVKAEIEKGKVVFEDQLDQLIYPEQELEHHITKITGITDDDLHGMPTYIEQHDRFVDFFLGERVVCAHNAPFDMGVLWYETIRHGLERHFPWPPIWHCTAEESTKINGKRLKLRDLHELATGEKHDEKAHRAMEDVYALIRCYEWMLKEGYFS